MQAGKRKHTVWVFSLGFVSGGQQEDRRFDYRPTNHRLRRPAYKLCYTLPSFKSL